MSKFRGVYGQISHGTGVLGGRSSSTSDETSRLELGGMQWFNEPTATVNLRNCLESQRITMDCVASARELIT